MELLLLGVAMPALGGTGALLVRSTRGKTFLGVGGALAGCLAGAIAASRVLLGGPPESLRIAWAIPYGSFFVQLDVLSAFFLLPVLGLSALAAVYGAGYMAHGPERGRGAAWFFFDVLVASMAIVVIARNAVLFLVAWEIMALASFFLVTHEDDDEAARAAGRTYLIATHLGTAWLLALFLLLGRGRDPLDFDVFAPTAGAGLLFVLALVGFGTKAGFMPFHVWLPEAHPAAPSHVSALMSGAMIKTGIYGLLRTFTFLGPLPAWAGWLLVAVGATSGVLGVLFALAQHDLKRLLAYSSVENVGIIALGVGLGLVGLKVQSPALAVLAFAGALLHVVNHAVFKGLLFLGAGTVLRATGTRDLDALGGLLRRMPRTGFAFVIGAAAICALPPLNGFVSEFLLYLAALGAASSLAPVGAVPGLVAIAALALIGGLAVACFTKACGIVFLGEPRSDRASGARDPGPCMLVPMQVLAAVCLVIGVGSPLLVGPLAAVVAQVTVIPADVVRAELVRAAQTLESLSVSVVALLLLAVVVAGLRRWLLAGRSVEATATWGCGYAQPSSRMQYTASSFAQPAVDVFAPLLGTRSRVSPPEGFFPRTASFASETPDLCRERLYRPAFSAIDRTLTAFRWVQHGRVQLYVLYIVVTLLVLLVWKLAAA